MKPLPKLRHTALAVALLLAALSSSALTLGRPRGAVIIGQPLDVAIPVRVENDEDAAAQCYEADVFLGDTRISGGRTSVAIEPGSSPQDMVVRVRSSAVVDEPVVSIYLRAGCAQRSTRRYVLLADVASEVVNPLNLPSMSRPAPLPSTATGTSQSSTAPATSRASPGSRASRATGNTTGGAAGGATGGTAGSGGVAAAAADTAPTQASAERRRQRQEARAAQAAAGTTAAASAPRPAAVVPSPAPARDSIVKRKPEPASRSRLKLDPLDLLVEVDPVLKGSAEILTPITENPQARAEAAALWRALNAQPLDILRDTQRLQGLEADVKSLRDVTTRNQASLADLQVRLQKAEGERYANVLVYSLGALLLAALALAGFLFWRSRNTAGEQVWWNGRTDDVEHEPIIGPSERPAGASGKPLTEVDVDLGMDENLFASLKTRPVSGPAVTAPPRYVAPPAVQHSDFSGSLPGMSRAVNAEELFDIQQQADFFMSLGQHDQAIEVLKNHISDNVETSALAYLDLLKIYHSLDRRADYDLLRADFNRVFNAQVPLFDSYSDASNGLESYQMAMSRIEALWPSAKVLEIIEESIFRKPGTGDGEAFDLEAYRELLLLYAIAKDVVDRQSESEFEVSSSPPDLDSSHRTTRFSATAIQPLSATNFSETDAADLLPEIPLPKPSPRIGLDIDLDEPGPDGPMVGGNEDKTDFFDMNDFHSESVMEDIDSMGQSRTEDEPPRAEKDSHLIDFDLFDESTEKDLAPKVVKPFKPFKSSRG